MPTESNPPGSSPHGVAAQPLDSRSVEGIFVQALNQKGGQPRSDFLDEACGNPVVRSRVEALLRAYDDAGSFLQQSHPSTALPAAWTRPWKLAGWLVVALLAIILVVPLLGVLALMISAHGRQLDIQEANVTNAHLTMTFDEELPIADIHLDGTSCGPIALSPVERGWPPGKHIVTVVYTHDDRMRSVRKTVELAPQEKRTLDLTPLVVGDMEEHERRARQTQHDRLLRPD